MRIIVGIGYITSDHKPILLDTNSINDKDTLFRYENMWNHSKNFQDRFSDYWKNLDINSSMSWPDIVIFLLKFKAGL